MKASKGKSQPALRRRTLNLKRRCEDPSAQRTDSSPSNSMFARLSPSAVEVLRRDALCQLPTEGGELGWKLAAGEENQIDFLPLSVQFSNNEIVYVSYNGGAAANCDGEDGDILELPASLIPKGFQSEHFKVQCAALASIQDADILNVEPLTCEDWELLEAGAAFLEDALLQQLSVVYSGQTLPLWVGGKDAAWVQVLPYGFQQKASAWPVSPGDSQSDCLRLVQDTRVVVSPKPRSSSTLSRRVLVFPTRDDYSEPSNLLAETLGKKQLCTSPGTILVHPSARLQLPGLNSEDAVALAIVWNATNGPSSEDIAGSCVLQLAFSNLVPEHHIAIHRLTRARLNVVALVDSVFIKVLSPIEVARATTMRGQRRGGREITLSPVDLVERRTSMKWRYPNNLNSQLWRGSSLPSTTCDDSSGSPSLHIAGEPVDNGSFLLSTDPHGDGCTIYKATIVVRKSEAEDFDADRSPSSGRWFLLRKELQQLGPRRTSLSPQNSAMPTRMIQDVTYELDSTAFILNLLPQDSHVPAELASLTERLGDALIYGAVGSGKSHTALVLAGVARFQSNASTFYLDCKRLKEGRGVRMKHILAELNQVFRDAGSCRGDSVVILDDLDALALNHEGDTGGDDSAQSHQVNPVAVDQAKLIGDTVQNNLQADAYKQISVIITCRDRRSLLPSVLNARAFARTLGSPTLDPLERETILWKMIVPSLDVSDATASDALKSCRIGRKTDGFRPRDLLLLASKVRHSIQGGEAEFTPVKVAACVSAELKNFKPLRQLSVSEGGSVTGGWTSIGGLLDVKNVLTSTILNPAKYRRIYERAKIRLPRGVLVFGCPGCGKSYLIPALAKKCGFSLVTCRGPELLDRYIGASESNVRELFARAAASSPSILFFDEIDALAPRRGSDRTGVTDRVVNQLLTLLDGVEDANAKGLVYIVAATSRPDIVDPALLRPGRLEKHVYVGYPANDDECTDLILKIVSRYSISDDLLESISSGRFVREVRSSLPNFHRLSPADFKAAFDTAQLQAIHELLERDESNQKMSIGFHRMVEALRSTRPSLPERDYRMLMEVYRPFRKHPTAEAGYGDSASGTGLHSRKLGRELRTALR